MKYLLLAVLFITAACQSNFLTPPPPTAASLGTPIISDSNGQAPEGIVPVEGISRVSLHADRSLRLEPSCTQVLKLSYSSNINYSELIVGLQNRAYLMGGNAISLVGWAENSSSSGMIGKIYICKKKPFHIHPH